MAAKLFGRVVRATIQPKDGDGFLVDGFDVAFDIAKTSEVEPNKGKITFFNLSEDLRNRLKLKDDATVELEAGYKDNVSVIFKGNITHAISEPQGPDIVTNMQAEEGVKTYRSSYVAATFGPGTPFKTVVKEIIKSFDGMEVTSAITRTLESIGTSFPNGLTIDGQSARVLNDVLKGVGLCFSIQKGQIQLVQSEGATDDPMIKLDYTTGLVGLPQLGEKKDKGTITFQSFIQPDLLPRRRVFVDWTFGQGEFVCSTVKHKGSTFDTEYYSTVEAFLP